MKALVYLGPGRMELQDAPDPLPGPGEVVIRSLASAICGSDLHGFRQASPRRIPPLIMGHETVGVIDSIGQGVDTVRPGERVVLKPLLVCGECWQCREERGNLCRRGRLVGRDLAGGFAELFTVSATAAVPIGADVPDQTATLTEPLANAVHVARRAIGHGERVLVIGAGPIGVLMAWSAAFHGADTVFVADPVAERLEFAEAQGAISLTGGDPAAALLTATDGEGADVVIDAAGFAETWALALRAVRPGGRIEAVGLGAPSGVVDFYEVVGKEAAITGSFAWTEADFARALQLVEQGRLDPAGWFTTMPLKEGQRAFEELVNGSSSFKIVLEP